MITIRVNDKEETIDAPEEIPLLWVIREELQLTGTKFGCGMGLCGACTVHLNGQAIRSCITPVGSVKDQAITTIEGIAAEGPHPIQTIWHEHNVAQCGYCQPGQIMNALALIMADPAPSDQAIDNAMAGNICRCGTYQRIKAAVRKAINVMADKNHHPNAQS